VIERDLELGGSQPLVRRHESLSEKIPTSVVNEQNDAAVAIVLSDILTECAQRFGDVSGGGEYGGETGESSWCHLGRSAGERERFVGTSTLTSRHAKVNHLQRVTFLAR
jgi:hypothetical protein